MRYQLLSYAAIGDAYGAGFEFVDEAIVQRENTLQSYRQHQKHTDIRPGMYTDDTQMSLAIAECMLSNQFTREDLAEAFVRAFKRDERAGYAGGFYAFLQSIQTGAEFLDRIQPYSKKNGAAMRVLAVGYYPDLQEVKDRAALQASLTHDTIEGVHSAEAAALLAHYCIYRLGDRKDLGAFLDTHSPLLDGASWQDPWKDPVPARGLNTVQAAVAAVRSSTSLSEILTTAIGYTGDVDTVATLALGAASCLADSIDDLPEWLFQDLEQGTYGKDYLRDLDQQLCAQFGFTN